MKDDNKAICYCGLPGNQKKNMLYCLKCKRWLHEECVKCLDVPMLLGDRFYILICSVCNSGSECLARIELKWPDVTHLVLYNLSVIHNKTYFDLDASIVPFLVENWLRFHLFGPITEVKDNDEIRGKVLDVLLHDGRYKSGREVKKSKNIFGLRNRIPPEPPSVERTSAKVKKDVLLWEFHVKERPYRFLTSIKPKKGSKDSTKNGNVKTRKKFPIPSNSKLNEDSKCSTDHTPQENGPQKATAKSRAKKVTPPFNEKNTVSGLLDTLIPLPPNFTGEDNPFLDAREKRALKRRKEKLSTSVKVETPVKVEEPPLKRKCNGEIQNGYHKQSIKAKNGRNHLEKSSACCVSDSEMFFDAKDYFSDDLAIEENGIKIMGRRVMNTKKVEYLFQKDR